MKILVLNGSPHTDKGATGTMLKALEKGLQTREPEIITKNIYKHNIKPCQGCFSCWTKTPGKCIQKDDMEKLVPITMDSDMVILATPLYVDGMTGPLKTFLDRLIPTGKGRVELRDDHMRHISRGQGRQQVFALVSPSGFAEMDNFAPLVTHVKAVARNSIAVYAGEVLAPSFWFYKYNDSLEEALEVIEYAGQELVKNGSIPRHVSEKLHEFAPRDKVVEAMNKYYGRFE